MALSYHYIIDSKLLFYSCSQTGRDVLDTFNEIARAISPQPPGETYITADLGSSAYRLGISTYYKGARREAKAKITAEEAVINKQFSEEYYKFIELCKKLPVKVLDVHDCEADDVASILAHSLAQDANNRISLITRDQDWYHSVIDTHNVKIVSPYYSEPDIYAKDAKEAYNVRSREEFTVKKALSGDSGDSICNITQIGKVAVADIWEECLLYPTITFDIMKECLFAHMSKAKTQTKYKVPKKYLEYGVTDTLIGVLDINYALAGTLMYVEQLTDAQQEQYHEAMQRPLGASLDPFADGIEIFGRPITLSDDAKVLFHVG